MIFMKMLYLKLVIIYVTVRNILLIIELAIVMAMMPETITQALVRGIHIVEDGFARGGMIVDWISKMRKEDIS